MVANLLAVLLLGFSDIDGDDSHSHRLRILNGEGAETSARTSNGHPLAWSNRRLFQSSVHRQTLKTSSWEEE